MERERKIQKLREVLLEHCYPKTDGMNAWTIATLGIDAIDEQIMCERCDKNPADDYINKTHICDTCKVQLFEEASEGGRHDCR